MKTDTQTTAASLRSVLATAAPDASEADLSSACKMIAEHAWFVRLGALAPELRGTVPALKSLVEVNRKILALVKALDNMGGDEKSALYTLGAPDQFEMMKIIADLNDYIVAAHKQISAAETIPTRGQGRQRDVATKQIADHAARIFAKITGTPAKFYTRARKDADVSPFAEYIRGVFKALAIEKSADHYARPVRETKRKSG